MTSKKINNTMIPHGETPSAATVGRDPVLGAEHRGRVPENAKRGTQTAAAAALCIGLVGTFSLPAHAVDPEMLNVTIEDFGVPAQSLETVDTDTDAAPEILPLSTPEVALSEEILDQERLIQAAADANADAAADANFAPLGKDIPAGEGAQGIVDAAMAQLGISQDCTDLVQNSLAAIGVIHKRSMGGFDLGPSSREHVALGGTIVTSGEYAPGDVLFWEGRHNAIYIGNGQAVHGGYNGNQTVIASVNIDGPPDTVVRFG